jgi:hypothetical protein
MYTLQGKLDQFAKATGKLLGAGLNLSQHIWLLQELIVVGFGIIVTVNAFAPKRVVGHVA